MAVLGVRFCARAFSNCSKWGPLFIAVRRPLTVAASLVAEHRLQMRRLSNCGSWARLFRRMWDPPRPGLEPVSPTLAGRFSTTVPPGKPWRHFLKWKYVDVRGLGDLSWAQKMVPGWLGGCQNHHWLGQGWGFPAQNLVPMTSQRGTTKMKKYISGFGQSSLQLTEETDYWNSPQLRPESFLTLKFPVELILTT